MQTADGKRNLFIFPHKAFRFMFCELLNKIGKVNYTNDKELEELQKDVNYAVHAYTTHNHDESTYWADLLKEKEPETVAKWLKDHEEHEHELHEFDKSIASIIAEKSLQKRTGLVDSLYQALADFLIGDLTHMREEQTIINDLYLKHYSVEEINGLEMTFIKQMDPKHMQALTPLLMRAHNLDGRAFLLGAIKNTGAPPPALHGILGLLRSINVPNEEITEIFTRVGLANILTESAEQGVAALSVK
jgi:hypothetical protein